MTTSKKPAKKTTGKKAAPTTASRGKRKTTGEWELFYHEAPFKGRAEFVRLMFETAGVPYVEKGGEEMYGLLAAFKPCAEILEMPDPNFAPPAIRNGDFIMTQTPAIMAHLGELFGMVPKAAAERAQAMQLALSVADALNECRAPFHPKFSSKSYSIQKDEAVVAVKEFCEPGTRFDHWICHFAHFINHRRAKCGKADGFLFGKGKKISFADISLYYMIEAMQQQYADGTPFPYWSDPSRAGTVKVLESFLATCRTVDNLRKYVESDRRKPWAGDSCM